MAAAPLVGPGSTPEGWWKDPRGSHTRPHTHTLPHGPRLQPRSQLGKRQDSAGYRASQHQGEQVCATPPPPRAHATARGPARATRSRTPCAARATRSRTPCAALARPVSARAATDAPRSCRRGPRARPALCCFTLLCAPSQVLSRRAGGGRPDRVSGQRASVCWVGCTAGGGSVESGNFGFAWTCGSDGFKTSWLSCRGGTAGRADARFLNAHGEHSFRVCGHLKE